MSSAAARAGARMPVVRRHLPTVDSTNTFAKSNARSFDPAALTVVSADEQTEGKGRLGRVWKSGGGEEDIKATFTFRLPPSALPTAYQLSPFVAVVATRVLRRRGVEAGIKWPNDLILAGCRKFAGILCELEQVDSSYWAALGLGINVNSSKDVLSAAVGPRPVWPLTTLKEETGTTFDVAALTNELVDAFAEVGGRQRIFYWVDGKASYLMLVLHQRQIYFPPRTGVFFRIGALAAGTARIHGARIRPLPGRIRGGQRAAGEAHPLPGRHCQGGGTRGVPGG